MDIDLIGSDRNNIHIGDIVNYKSALKSCVDRFDLRVFSYYLSVCGGIALAERRFFGEIPAAVALVIGDLCSAELSEGFDLAAGIVKLGIDSGSCEERKLDFSSVGSDNTEVSRILNETVYLIAHLEHAVCNAVNEGKHAAGILL